jgi:hypothetical protein
MEVIILWRIKLDRFYCTLNMRYVNKRPSSGLQECKGNLVFGSGLKREWERGLHPGPMSSSPADEFAAAVTMIC